MSINKDEIFSYVNGLLLYISKNTEIPSKELIDIFMQYNAANNESSEKATEVKKVKKVKKINLEYIVLDKKEYLLDNSKNDLYTFDDAKTFVGKYDVENDCINYFFL